MTTDQPIRLSQQVKCAGCAAKLSPVLLREALSSLPKSSHKNLLVGSDTLDDAGVFKINDDLAIINTTDFFPPIVDDPETFGQIAAVNAMSDVYAMGGEVMTAMNIVSFPKELPGDVLNGILRGSHQKVTEAGGVVVGGHTVATDSLLFGLALTGTVHPKRICTNADAQPGDVLILTKALGTGIITTAMKRDLIPQEQGSEAIFSMTQLNAGVAKIMRQHSIKAAVDITGFGLLGHAMQMAQASKVSFELIANKIPLFKGALKLSKEGVITGAATTNNEYIQTHLEVSGDLDKPLHDIFLDPQTSGGMLFSAKANEADDIIAELIEADYPYSTVVGAVHEVKGRAIYLKY